MKKQMGLCLLAALLSFSGFVHAAEAPTEKLPVRNNAFVGACQKDIQTLCSKVQPGEGRILKCLEENKKKVSAECNQVRGQVRANMGQKNQSEKVKSG